MWDYLNSIHQLNSTGDGDDNSVSDDSDNSKNEKIIKKYRKKKKKRKKSEHVDFVGEKPKPKLFGNKRRYKKRQLS